MAGLGASGVEPSGPAISALEKLGCNGGDLVQLA